MSETDLVKACKDYLDLKGIFNYRQNTGAFKTERGFYRFGCVGSPDIVAVINGKYIGIECKNSKNKQSKGQKVFEQRLKRAGGEYRLIHSIEELILKFN